MTFIFQGIEGEEPIDQQQIAEPTLPEETGGFVFQGIEKPTSEKKAEKVAKGLRFYGIEPSPEFIGKIRHPIGVGMKGLAKGILGTPGELLKFGQKLTGTTTPFNILPTTENIGNMFEKLSGEEFNPENLTEESIDRGTEFLGGLLGLGGPLKGATLLKTFGRTALAAFAPAGVSLFAEKVNLPPWVQAASTIGTSFLAHRLTGKGLRDIERGLYGNARTLARDATVSANSLRANIRNLVSKFSKGGIEASDKEALRKLGDIKSHLKISDRKYSISVDDLMSLKTKINEARGQLFAKDLGRTGVRAARKKLNDVSKLVDKTVKSFDNPQFQKIYKQANQLHGGIAESTKMGKWMVQNKILTGSAGVLLKTLLPGIIGKGAIGLGVVQAGKMLKAFTKYPGYRKAYFEILKNAAKEEVRATATSVNKFNKKTKELLPEISED